MFGFGSNESLEKPGDDFRAAEPPAPQPPDSADLDSETFFNKYRSLLTPDEIDKFRALVGKTRASSTQRYYVRRDDPDCTHGFEMYWPDGPMDLQRSEEVDFSQMQVLLIEDVDVRRLLQLDSIYQLDPQLVLAYAGVGDKRSPGLDEGTVPGSMAGKWYTTEMSMLLKSPWETEDSQTVKNSAFLELPYYKALYQLSIRRNRAPAD